MFTLSLHPPHLWIHLTPPATLRRVAAPSPGSGCQRPGLEAGLWTGFESSHVTCSMRVCKSSLRPGGRREAVPGDGKPRVNGGNAHVQASGLLPGGDTQHGARVSNSPREPAARCVAPAPRAGPAAASRPLPPRCAADAAVPSNGAFWFNSLHTRSLRD